MSTSRPAFDDCLRTQGTLRKILAPGLYEAALPNGKPLIAHLSKELAAAPPALAVGDIVEMEVSPFDLDRGRIYRVSRAS